MFGPVGPSHRTTQSAHITDVGIGSKPISEPRLQNAAFDGRLAPLAAGPGQRPRSKAAANLRGGFGDHG
jgi:hypothetical protein